MPRAAAMSPDRLKVKALANMRGNSGRCAVWDLACGVSRK